MTNEHTNYPSSKATKIIAIVLLVGIVPAVAFFIGVQYQRTIALLAKAPQTIGSQQSNVLTAINNQYAYSCTNGSQFIMIPSNDFSQLHIKPSGSESTIPDVQLIMGNSPHGAEYESDGVVFLAHGEKVNLTVGTTSPQTTICSPVTEGYNAPINFGD